MSKGLNIRLENNLNSTIITKARKGDIYKLKSEKGSQATLPPVGYPKIARMFSNRLNRLK